MEDGYIDDVDVNYTDGSAVPLPCNKTDLLIK